MVEKVTKGIKVVVKHSFEGVVFRADKDYFGFLYTSSIENQSSDYVQLLSQHLEVSDAFGSLYSLDEALSDHPNFSDQNWSPVSTVKTLKVKSLKPIIKPGETFTFTSPCIINSSIGMMKGHFKMINFTSAKTFKVCIPKIKLCAPFSLN